MPFIHIKSLPLEKTLDVPHVLGEIARDFSDKVGVELEHIHTTWEYFQPGHYARGDKTAIVQPDTNFPIIVDLLAPDFNNKSTVELMLEAVAGSISKRTGFPVNNIFINFRQAHSGMVFDEGKTVHWEVGE